MNAALVPARSLRCTSSAAKIFLRRQLGTNRHDARSPGSPQSCRPGLSSSLRSLMVSPALKRSTPAVRTLRLTLKPSNNTRACSIIRITGLAQPVPDTFKDLRQAPPARSAAADPAFSSRTYSRGVRAGLCRHARLATLDPTIPAQYRQCTASRHSCCAAHTGPPAPLQSDASLSHTHSSAPHAVRERDGQPLPHQTPAAPATSSQHRRRSR